MSNKRRIKYNVQCKTKNKIQCEKKILKNYFRLCYVLCLSLLRINLLSRKWQVHVFNHIFKIEANRTEENRISWTT